MNPLVCLNSDYITTKTSSPGFTLLPGNYIYALYGNLGNDMDFQMLSAFILRMICNYDRIGNVGQIAKVNLPDT